MVMGYYVLVFVKKQTFDFNYKHIYCSSVLLYPSHISIIRYELNINEITVFFSNEFGQVILFLRVHFCAFGILCIIKQIKKKRKNKAGVCEFIRKSQWCGY
jgi:hypothetical protein